MFDAIFDLVYMYRATIVFGTMKDDGLLIDTLALNVTETSSKMASTLSQKWLTFFPKKLKILYISCHTISFKFHQHVVQILTK